METRRIGALEVTVVGLGCNNFGGRLDAEGTRAVVDAALDAGINFFDTADIYGGTKSEEFLGRALGARRDEIVLATKFGMAVEGDPDRSGGSARWIATAVEDSLRRLGTDRIDLYQFHCPDPKTPVEETLDALDGLVRAGKVREIGNSNFSGAQITEADALAAGKGAARFVSAQNRYSLLSVEYVADVIPACVDRGLALIPYFPLESGTLTGKYKRGAPPPPGTRLAGMPEERRAMFFTEERMKLVERLDAFARDNGHTLLELAIAWLLAQPVIPSVIAGATSPQQIEANARAAAWSLTEAQMTDVETLLAG